MPVKTKSKNAPRMLMQGNIALSEAAIRVGCRFFAGYPITPSSEIMMRIAELLRAKGGTFIQMEDEIASICAVIGASWSGAKAMTATSGPGFSLMQEGLGYAYFTETPLVLVDVQRAGPATGQATHVAQGDVMQLKYGSHGDCFPIAVAPWSPQEMYDLTVRAFNLAEKYRVPVFVATDEAVAHARENVEIREEFEIVDRIRKGEGTPFGHDAPDGVPVMPAFGDGAALMVTGSTHDALGFRKVDDPDAHDALVTRLMRKITDHADEIVETEDYYLDDAEIGLFSFGISARTSLAAVRRLRDKGVRIGLLRARTLWPFPEKQVSELGRQVRALVVPELNKGMYASVARAYSEAPVHQINKTNGYALEPKELIRYVEEELQ